MLPDDDPRHGTNAGHHAGCRKDCCRLARNRDQKRRRVLAEQGIRLSVPAHRAQRRILALMFNGWTTTEIAKACGWSHRNSVKHILDGQGGRAARWVERRTFDTIDRVYREWMMTIPPCRDGAEQSIRTRARNASIKRGGVSPLAWDDIDNDPEPADSSQPCVRPNCAGRVVALGLCRTHYNAQLREKAA